MKTPKWNHRARLGQFVGFLDENSSLVSYVRHIITGYIYPQFHFIFDNYFETIVCQGDNKSTIEEIWWDLFNTNRYWYYCEDFDDAINLIYRPLPLRDVWLDERGSHDMKQELAQKRKHTDYRLCKRNRAIPEIILLNTKYDDNYYPRSAPISDDELSVDSYVGWLPSE